MEPDEAEPGRRGRRRVLAGSAAAIVAAAVAVVTILATHNADGAAPRPIPPIVVTKFTPTSGARLATSRQPITITFSVKLAAKTPLPTVTGATGRWVRHRATLVFFPNENYLPYTPITVVVPTGRRGIASADGAHLKGSVRARYLGEIGTTLRLQQLLAELGYLPLSFHATDVSGVGQSELLSEPDLPGAIAIAPESGVFTWRFAHIPRQLALNWQVGTWNEVTKGAVMAFQSEHNLSPDGEPGAAVWRALLAAVAARTSTGRPYDYVLVSESVPETLYAWQDGSVVLQSPTNTGGAGAATPLGTWPVYLRFVSTTMSGTNPDGSHYSDPDVPWVSYFFNSDAVHGFDRPVYGVPQSDGCVELPPSTAGEVFPDDPIGTLVTVTNGDLSNELSAAPPVEIGSFAPPVPPPTATREHAPRHAQATSTTSSSTPKAPPKR